ncbi:MAG TPA: cation diffusion facilitator family transporter [Propionibacteriaceae bacterium]|nr:cation diffusion facilitator family transporter [Propionibacteriaceae bacterium]
MVVAVAANLLIAVAKGVAALLTGSAAMLAETTHSIADTFNEVLLYVGVRSGARPADERHPFAYGKAGYIWSLLAAVGIFVVGGLFAIAVGVQTLRSPEPVTNVAVGVAVLLISAGLEATSWRRARRQLRSEAAARHLDLGEYLVTSSDPTPAAVFLEDSAALVGIALALAALALHIATGSALWDGAASLLIGLLLIAVAVVLMRRNLALLTDEAAPADIRERLRQAVAREPWVAEVAELTAVYIGPRHLLVLAHVVPVDGADLPANIGRLRRRLLAVPAIAAVEITPIERTP